MKNIANLFTLIRNLLLLFFCIIISGNIYAEKNPDDKKSNTRSTKAAACVPATGCNDLNINNVRARINTGGDMWWDLQSNPKYEIPKESGKMSMYSGSLWMGGLDVNGQLKLAALRYRQKGNDFWPGPLTTDGTASVEVETCEQYDKHFVMTRAEVDQFLAWWNDLQQGGNNFPNYTIPNSILNWPAHGDVTQGQSYYLAPFYDNDGDGTYNPLNGDYPYYDIDNHLCPPDNSCAEEFIPEITMEGNGILSDQALKGDQTLWWVFNDKGNAHTETQGQPIGMEIRAQAFAFATNDEINNMTFYTYELINRSTYCLTETYFSQFVDTDLGFAEDDYVGCDVQRGLGYCYNGNAIDGSGQPQAYGQQPPAIGVDFFQGPYMDPDGLDNPKYDLSVNANGDTTEIQRCDASINGVNFGDCIVDNERFGMRRFIFFNNTGGGGNDAMTDPEIAIEYYNYLKSIWKDNTKMLYGGIGHVSDPSAYGPECDFMFPGDTDPCNWGTGGMPPNGPTYWTEETSTNVPYDRRFLESAGPFTLEPGAVNYITVGIPWARASAGGPFASVELLRLVDDKCQRLFDNCFKVIDGPDSPELTAQELDRTLILYISNPEFSNNYLEEYEEFDPSIISPDSFPTYQRYDSLYRFEGYQIFQLKDASVSIADIHDPDLVRLVAQCDIENYDKDDNPIGQLVNYQYSEDLGGNIPVEEVNGANEGIIHSFKITDDKFATGDKTLVNHKQYYYLALSYGYNEFKKYSQDVGVLGGLYGQKKTYLAGRKNSTGGAITFITAIPHIPSPESEGTILQASYGSGPKITRIEGQGNGGMTIDLTEVSINKILSGPRWFILTPTYNNGKGPVNIKVIDPLNIKKGNFTLKFDVKNNKIDTARWTLIDNDTYDIIFSDKTIAVANEQLLADLGLSVTINQVKEPGDLLGKNNGLIESSAEYADSSRQWLSGVPDIDGGSADAEGNPSAWNWIRSGTLRDMANGNNNDYDLVSNQSLGGIALDPNENYEKILSGTFAPYRMSSKYKNGPAMSPLIPSLYKLENLASIDLIITPDNSKWSRSAVIEMCEEQILSEGNAKKFELRKGQSVDIYGNPDGTGTGMSWFPGYAINVETGERLNIVFAEDSWLIGENGRDMIWNPTSNYTTSLGEILFGGKHCVYIVGHNTNADDFNGPAYDECAWIHDKLLAGGSSNIRNVYKDFMWAGIPMALKGEEWLSNEVKVRIRVSKPYKSNYSTYGSSTPQNNNYPMYTFSTDDLETIKKDAETAKNALDIINIVPNPYYAYSTYETSQLDNRVRITNLPVKCTVTIYTLNGILVRQYTKDSEITSLDWDLKNYAGIPIAGGIYIIYIKADGIGERVIKWFGSLRPIDLNAF
jgi:hypothetical protein